MTSEAVVLTLLETLKGADLDASVGFCVHGEEASRHYAIDFAGRSCAEDDLAAFEAADVRVYAFEDAFGDLLRAPEAIAGHLCSGEIVVEGDRAVLTRLAQLLEKPKSALGTRLGLLAPVVP